MAEIRDEFGNPIQLTDEHGNPVQLTDEYGNPMHLTGVAVTTAEPEKLAATDLETTPATRTAAAAGAREQQVQQEQQQVQQEQQHEEVKRSSSSSSGSSEDEGQLGGEGEQGTRRRRKKGLKEKIKEKLTGGKQRWRIHTPQLFLQQPQPQLHQLVLVVFNTMSMRRKV